MTYQTGLIDDSNRDAFAALVPEYLFLRPEVQLIGVVDEEQYAVGVLAFTTDEEVADVLFIGSLDEENRISIGRLLLEKLRYLIESTKCGLMIQIMWADGEGNDYPEILDGLEEYAILEDACVFVISPEQVKNAEALKVLRDAGGKVQNYRELPKEIRKAFHEEMRNQGMNLYLDASYMEDMSACCISEDDTIMAAALFRQHEECIELAFLYSDQGKVKALGTVLSAALVKYETSYGEETLEFSAVSEESLQLAKKFFGEEIVPKKIYTAVSFGRI